LLPGHVYFEAGVFVIVLVWLGKWLETRARAGTQDALLALARLQPKTARVETEGGWVSRDVRLLRVGDVVRVEPGEAFPADGEVLSGATAVDESMLTGEAMPIDKVAGDAVYAGTLNRQGTVRCRVNRPALESQLARIIALVRDAQASKAPIQSLADRISARFVPGVLGIAALTFVAWWWYSAGLETALVNAVAVLVIACPCALGLATPTAIVVGTGVAARHGILIRHASAIEAAARLKWLALDKTGTLTEGRPSVVQADFGAATPWVQAAAAGSRHPLAQALAEVLARDRTIQIDRLEQIAGQGLEAELNDGTTRRALRLGRPEWVGMTAVPNIPPDASVVAASLDGRLVGHAVLADRLRPDAEAALAVLRAQGITPVLLTGDRAEAAAAVAQRLGIEHWQAGCLPADKAAAIAKFKADGPTGMAGDGLNDAPALAAADVSLAIGQGAEAAIAAADLTLARPDAMAIADALAIARATLQVIRQNLGFAFVYNLVGIPAAALGYLHPAMAGAAMAASSLSVLLNALRLRRWQPHSPARPSGAR
jgi:Cu+-exporting ATPase